MVFMETISAVVGSPSSSPGNIAVARVERVKHPAATGHSTIHVEGESFVRAPKTWS